MNRIQIVIPMSGYGERFRRAGYSVPKPLIEVFGKPIIAHVLDLFPGEKAVWFVCNREHLENPEWRLEEALHQYCPTGRVCGIAPHKLGPVYAVSQIAGELDPAAPTVVNYCDFSGRWDWEAFKRDMRSGRCDGAVVCYTGFHPHMLHSTNYAYVRTEDRRVLAIQEKQPYTDTPMLEYASSGTYYFRSAALMQEAFAATLQREDLRLNGEYYVSLAYRPLLERGLDVRVFEMQKFFQWGTPEDLSEWLYHMKAAILSREVQTRPEIGGILLLPMAGLGSRFADEGYSVPKPLIPVNSGPMALRAWADLPQTGHNKFILRRDLPFLQEIEKVLKEHISEAEFAVLDQTTDGQARTCLLGFDGLDPDSPLTIGACDNGLRYNAEAFLRLWNDSSVDVVVWTARGYPGAVRTPCGYGWVDADECGRVRRLSVKVPLDDPARDPIVTGAFSFKRAGDFRRSAERMIARKGLVNGEYYVDECINDALELGLHVRIFDVDAYLCWGTPNDFRTFEYWHEVIV